MMLFLIALVVAAIAYTAVHHAKSKSDKEKSFPFIDEIRDIGRKAI